MDPLKDLPFVAEYLDRLQTQTGTRVVSPALRVLLEQLGLWFARLPPSPLQIEVDRAAAADLRLAPPGKIQWRPGDAVFFDATTGKHTLRNGTGIEVRPLPPPSSLEEAIAAKTRDMIMDGVTTDAAVRAMFAFKAPPEGLPLVEQPARLLVGTKRLPPGWTCTR